MLKQLYTNGQLIDELNNTLNNNISDIIINLIGNNKEYIDNILDKYTLDKNKFITFNDDISENDYDGIIIILECNDNLDIIKKFILELINSNLVSSLSYSNKYFGRL